MSERPVVPEGFTTLNITEPFSTRVGPIYGRRDGDMLRLGFVVDASHLNIEGVAHGGMLSTMADQVIGMNIALANNQGNDVLTLHLSVDFIGPAYLGDWVEGIATLSKVSGRVRFGSCELWVQDRLVLKASAIFAARVKRNKVLAKD